MPTNKVNRNEVYKELNDLETYLKQQHKQQKQLFENVDSRTLDKNEAIREKCFEQYNKAIELVNYLIEHPTSKFNPANIAYKKKRKKIDKLFKNIAEF